MIRKLLLLFALPVSAVLGATTPTFADRYDYAALCIGPGPAVAAVDVNNDGIPDLVCSGNPIVLLGNGDGTFRPGPVSHLFDGGASSPLLFDLNGDGNLYLIGTTSDTKGRSDCLLLWVMEMALSSREPSIKPETTGMSSSS